MIQGLLGRRVAIAGTLGRLSHAADDAADWLTLFLRSAEIEFLDGASIGLVLAIGLCSARRQVYLPLRRFLRSWHASARA